VITTALNSLLELTIPILHFYKISDLLQRQCCKSSVVIESCPTLDTKTNENKNNKTKKKKKL